jgi:hypothetical protein
MSGKAVQVRSSALYFSCKTCKNEKPPMFVSELMCANVFTSFPCQDDLPGSSGILLAGAEVAEGDH